MRAVAIFAAMSVAVLVTGSARAQDAAAGEKVFAKCKICHVADKDQNKVGPSLHGDIGRTAGTHPGNNNSPAKIAPGKSV
jgi:cytochrome c